MALLDRLNTKKNVTTGGESSTPNQNNEVLLRNAALNIEPVLGLPVAKNIFEEPRSEKNDI